jgi:large subunit ribosomal protein L21
MYAIIRLGGKQYRVSEGERLVVDRLRFDESATFNPDVLFVGGGSDSATVTARVVEHKLGPKIRIGKYKKRTGYKRHTGYRSRLSEIEIQSIGAAKSSRKAAEKPKEESKAVVETAPAGLPDGYADMTVAQINDGAKSWSPEQIQAALEYEQAHAKRKGALSALESAAKTEED